MSKHKRAKGRKTQNLEIDRKDVKILRTVGEQEAFHFYEDIGKPTGHMARNLSDFLDKVKSINSESLMFHLQRDDFQKWIEKTLGDSQLAKKLRKISCSNSNDARMSICRAVENRIKELGDSSASVLVGDDLVLVLPSS